MKVRVYGTNVISRGIYTPNTREILSLGTMDSFPKEIEFHCELKSRK